MRRAFPSPISCFAHCCLTVRLFANCSCSALRLRHRLRRIHHPRTRPHPQTSPHMHLPHCRSALKLACHSGRGRTSQNGCSARVQTPGNALLVDRRAVCRARAHAFCPVNQHIHRVKASRALRDKRVAHDNRDDGAVGCRQAGAINVPDSRAALSLGLSTWGTANCFSTSSECARGSCLRIVADAIR
jgi:hypothetical protein